METHPPVMDRRARIPPFVWFLGVGLIVALAAIFIFNADVNTVVYYGFFSYSGGHRAPEHQFGRFHRTHVTAHHQ